MNFIKDIHKASKDISEEFEKNSATPKWIAYPIMFIILFFIISINIITGKNNG